jgi:hypothetical protein
MKNIAQIITIGMAVATTAYVVPSSHYHSPPPPSSTTRPIRRSSTSQSGSSSTSISFRDDDVAEMDVERDFQSKMRDIVAQRTRRRREAVRPANVRGVVSLEEFANVINEGRKEGRLVVVRFHATWCKVRGVGTSCCDFFFFGKSVVQGGLNFATGFHPPNALLSNSEPPPPPDPSFSLPPSDVSRHTPLLRQGGNDQSPRHVRRRSRP